MPRYEDYVKLARCYAQEAREAQRDSKRARDCWGLALYYQKQAATVSSGEAPDIGKKPAHI
jgi:hypothetical protein